MLMRPQTKTKKILATLRLKKTRKIKQKRQKKAKRAKKLIQNQFVFKKMRRY